ncbi:MAG: HAMP domain-containing histidine kinase [Desulfobacterales bacterium]|nr:HAMP domain-containing histidine kinase [Desulfobacterales bacterium]
MTLGIAKKLSVFFFLFILIFFSTVADLFIRVREMSRISDRIVSVNTEVGALNRNLKDSLIDMEANLKKYRLLQKEAYFEYFETARMAYTKDLNRILQLTGTGVTTSAGGEPGSPWLKIREDYNDLSGYRTGETLIDPDGTWASDDRLTLWMAALNDAGRVNREAVDAALIRMNALSRQVLRNGIIGFGISILVGALGVIFISRSVLSPLRRLKKGLNQVSDDDYTHVLPVTSGDEFGQLATAFNRMNRQLQADEGLRSDFIATLSHEIRTPLSSIRESVNMIAEEVLGAVNEKQKKFLKIAGDETHRITYLLNHLLDTSVLAAGAEKAPPVPLNAEQLVRETVEALQATAAAKQIELRQHSAQGLPKAMGEAKEIRQVLINLIGNALKFSPENSRVDIRITAEKDRVKFSISDQGPGIPEEKQAMIFKKYYRDDTVRKHMDGVGLGLSIARQIVRAHGGTIDLQNNTDGGCTFFFTLPVEK